MALKFIHWTFKPCTLKTVTTTLIWSKHCWLSFQRLGKWHETTCGGNQKWLRVENLKTYIVVSCRPAGVELHVKLSFFPGELVVFGLLLSGKSVPLRAHKHKHTHQNAGRHRGTSRWYFRPKYISRSGQTDMFKFPLPLMSPALFLLQKHCARLQLYRNRKANKLRFSTTDNTAICGFRSWDGLLTLCITPWPWSVCALYVWPKLKKT